MSASNGHRGPGAGAAAARPVMLVRYRPGVVGETARTVHVVPLPTDGQAGVVGALCGAALMLDGIETVIPGQGMPCTACVVNQALGTAPIGEPPAGSPDGAGAALAAGGACYQEWAWPVILHRDQVRLSLDCDASALAIPVPLCAEVTQILTQRRCAPPVLAHPYLPEHHIVLTGERYTASAGGLLAAVPRDRPFWGAAHRAERLPAQRRPTVRARSCSADRSTPDDDWGGGERAV